MSVSTSNMVEETTNMTHIINKYTKLDPTLPRINTIPCPNVECPTNTNEKSVKLFIFDTTKITSDMPIYVPRVILYGKQMINNCRE